MKINTKYLETGIFYFALGLFVVVLLIVGTAFLKANDDEEAYIGDFSSGIMNSGWNVSINGENETTVTLPAKFDCEEGSYIIMYNTLSPELSDGMSIMFRAEMQDVLVYIDDELRTSYLAEDIGIGYYYLPSAYIITDLSKEDAGKIIRYEIIVKNNPVLNEISLGYGNNGWFSIIKENVVLFLAAILVMLAGIGVLIFYEIFKIRVNVSRSVLFLGMLMMMTGTWVLSESRIRQLIFRRPSITNLFAYLSLDIIGILVVLYFDEVQKRRYHTIYLIIETGLSLQTIINCSLDSLSISEFHQTLIFVHFWMLLGLMTVAVSIIRDIVIGEVKTYRFIAAGMGTFLLCCVFELINYYFSDSSTRGPFLCLGFIMLMFATIIQVINDEGDKVHSREKATRDSWIRTVETISSAIESKDEYTGGHSNRVGEYAAILAREMAADYDFTEEDILRIRYIGLMHDIGKIGVADPILNKAGRLTDEEFSLMKKHVEIGYDLLDGMGNTLDGLLDGVRYHHERFDGRGYPDGLEGTDIPLIARILCLADCYDAMTSNRVYRRRLSDEEVRAEIIKCAGSQFDPALAEIFVRIIDRGGIKPSTIGGMEVKEDGELYKSSLLEERLQKDMATDTDHAISNPSHIRMLSYIVKLAEHKGRNFEMLFVQLVEDNTSEDDNTRLNDLLKPYMLRKDICIEYTKNQNIVVLFDRTKEETEEFKSSVPKTIRFMDF